MLARRALAASLILLAPTLWVVLPASADTAVSGELVSFDGTPIAYTLFLPAAADAENPVPVVLRTHGWGGSRETTAGATIQALLNANYAVLTWDSRGFGVSGGKVQLNSPDYEVRDASALMTMLESNPAIAKDATGVLVGMSGGSYAGGIQLLTSAFDARVRAIAPEITWSSLPHSLAPDNVVKNQWIQALFWAGLATSTTGGLQKGRADGYDTNLPTYWATTMATNGAVQETYDALWYRSPAAHAATMTAPALLMNGWTDSLFTASEAIANYNDIKDNGVEAKLLFFCGGHSGCPYPSAGQRAFMDASIVNWFDAHVKGLEVSTGEPVQWFDSANTLHTASAWPIPGTTMATAAGSGTLLAQPAPTTGGVALDAGSTQASREPVTSFRVPVTVPDGAQITGVARATVTINCGAPCVDVTLFLRLVDIESSHVLDGVTTPIRFDAAGTETTDLVAVSYALPAGHHLALEVSTNDAAFLASRVPGIVNVEVAVEVPVVN